MLLATLLTPYAGCRFRPRNSAHTARTTPRPPCGVLTNKLAGSNESFVKLHKEVQQDSEWYGPEAPDHAVSPAAVAAAPATAATRCDVRLMASFTKFLKSNKLDLSALFCSEAVLSADSRLVCDPQEGHHAELLSEFLTSGGLRVGEELPHWFVNGNMRGAIKCWMATRPAAAALAEAAAAAAVGGSLLDCEELQRRRRELAASVSENSPLGPAAAGLVDHLLAAMPAWNPNGPVAELAGWEPTEGVTATAEDVAALHCFGALVYGSRLDTAEFLQQLCGADPFSWVAAQMAQGVISEPEPWLLERFFMSRHAVGEALPLWFAKWGVREEVGKWLRDPKAAELVQRLLEARGIATTASTDAAPAADAGASAEGASAASSDPRDARSTALALLESSAVDLLSSAMSRQGLLLSRSIVAASISCHRDVRLYDKTDPAAVPHAADLLATCGGLDAALVAIAVQVPHNDSYDLAAVVRQAKERLDWLGFLLLRAGTEGGGLGPKAAVAKVLLLPPEGEAAAAAGAEMSLPPSVAEYLAQGGVLCVRASELPYKAA